MTTFDADETNLSCTRRIECTTISNRLDVGVQKAAYTADYHTSLRGEDMTKPTIGFLGLGLMGGAMVARLQDQGYALTVLGNRDRTELDKAIAVARRRRPHPGRWQRRAISSCCAWAPRSRLRDGCTGAMVSSQG